MPICMIALMNLLYEFPSYRSKRVRTDRYQAEFLKNHVTGRAENLIFSLWGT